MDIENGTLAANVVSTVTIDPYLQQITVQCHGDNGEEIWFTMDGTTPTVGGHNVFWTNGNCWEPTPSYSTATTVKLLSTSNVAFTVKGEA